MQPILFQRLSELRGSLCADDSPEFAAAFKPKAISTLLYALTLAHPRPLGLWPLIEHGLPEFGLGKQEAGTALIFVGHLRLTRIRHSCFLALTRHGKALAGEVIAHFHTLH